MKALKYLTFVGKLAGVVSSLGTIPFVDPKTGVIIFAAASILKDAVNRIGDLLDDGQRRQKRSGDGVPKGHTAREDNVGQMFAISSFAPSLFNVAEKFSRFFGNLPSGISIILSKPMTGSRFGRSLREFSR